MNSNVYTLKRKDNQLQLEYKQKINEILPAIFQIESIQK
jgi:hypothetical protein